MAMDESSYEFLIRSVFECGRTKRFGDDADMFVAWRELLYHPMYCVQLSKISLALNRRSCCIPTYSII